MYHFCFNFILFGHTSHTNFDFNLCSVFTESRFRLWKRFEHLKSLLLKLPPPGKKIPSAKFPIPPPPHPLPLFGKPWYINWWFLFDQKKFLFVMLNWTTRQLKIHGSWVWKLVVTKLKFNYDIDVRKSKYIKNKIKNKHNIDLST